MVSKSRHTESAPPASDQEPSPKGFASYTDELEFRRARYNHIEYEPDRLGRTIGVRRMRLSEKTRLTAMTPDLGGMDEMQRPDQPGVTMLVPQRAQYFIAASVCKINDSPIPFARNRGELDAILDRLDEEGMEAAGAGVSRLLAADDDSNPLDQAKNLSGIPGSE